MNRLSVGLGCGHNLFEKKNTTTVTNNLQILYKNLVKCTGYLSYSLAQI